MVTSQAPEVAALPGEAADPLEGAQERVRGQVLGELAVADPEVDEPEDRVHVPVVDQAERLGLAGLGPLDQRPHLGRRVARVGAGRVLRRLVLGGSLSLGGPVVLCAGTTTVCSPGRAVSGSWLRWPAVGWSGIGGRPGTATRPPLGTGLALPVGGMRTARRLVDVRAVAGPLRAVAADRVDDHVVDGPSEGGQALGECEARREDIAVVRIPGVHMTHCASSTRRLWSDCRSVPPGVEVQ